MQQRKVLCKILTGRQSYKCKLGLKKYVSLKLLNGIAYLNFYVPFQCLSTFFKTRGTLENLFSVWRNLDAQNSANLRILTEPSEE